jgi:hypothetical protein
MMTTWRRPVAALLATGLFVLGACGGDDDDSKGKKNSGDQTAESTATTIPPFDKNAPAADSKFCKDAIALIQKSVNPNEASSNEQQLEDALKLDPPAEIADAWRNVLTTEQEIEKLDPKDPKASEKAATAANKVQADQGKIVTYLTTKCGINMTSGGSGSSGGSTVTTG